MDHGAASPPHVAGSLADSLAVLARLDRSIPSLHWPLLERWASGQTPAPEVRPAASVVLVAPSDSDTDDADRGLQVCVQHRAATMSFAAGMWSFPGGQGDPGESVTACAVREFAEETGLALSESELIPWAHWITPAFMPKRFDTRFFLVIREKTELVRDRSGESQWVGWRSPAELLAETSTATLMPPTRSLLLELADHTLAEVAAAGAQRLVHPVLPEAVHSKGVWHWRYPERSSS